MYPYIKVEVIVPPEYILRVIISNKILARVHRGKIKKNECRGDGTVGNGEIGGI